MPKNTNTKQKAGVHIDGKWANAKEVDIVIKKKNNPKAKVRTQRKKLRPPKRLRMKTMPSQNFLDMIVHKECLNPLVTSNLLLTSLFNPSAGRSRGIAFGTENTAIAHFRVPFEVTVPGNQTVIMDIIPFAVLTNQFVTYGTYAGALQTGTNIDLSNSTVYTSVTQLGSPVTNTTTTRFRLTGLEVNVISDASFLNRSGWSQMTYIDNFSDGTYTRSSGGSGYYQGPGTYGALENYPMTQKFNGDKDTIHHWFPNDDEIYLQDYVSIATSSATAPNLSGFKWIGYASGSQNVSYNFDIGVTLEYVPVDATRAIVNKAVSIVHPLAEYYLNMLVADRWRPLVIAELQEWRQVIQNKRPELGPLRTADQFRMPNLDVRANYTSAINESNFMTLPDYND